MICLNPQVLLQEDLGFFFPSCSRDSTILKFSFINYQTSLLAIKISAGFPTLGSAKLGFGDCHPVLVHHGDVAASWACRAMAKGVEKTRALLRHLAFLGTGLLGREH